MVAIAIVGGAAVAVVVAAAGPGLVVDAAETAETANCWDRSCGP